MDTLESTADCPGYLYPMDTLESTTPYCRNIFEVAREERSRLIHEQLRDRPPSPELKAMIERRNAGSDLSAPSIDGLEVVELTVLDISPAAAPR